MSATGELLGLARALVKAPSENPPGDERAVAGVLQEALPALGLPAPRVIADRPERPNLLATVDFGPGGRHLVLSGHTDTKPVGDARWSADPFAAAVDGDRLIGLGAADMKAALAAMTHAAAVLADDPPAAGRLSLLFTADEEDGAAFGARHVTHAVDLEADGVVIGEPGGIERDFDRLHVVSRGIARLRVHAAGTQGHSSLAGALPGRNAGVDAAAAVLALDALRIAAPHDPYALEGWDVTLNTGLAYRGGVGFGVLPGAMTVDSEVRLLPDMSRADVAGPVEGALARVPGADLALEWENWLPATLVAPDHELAVAAARACERALGTVPPPAVFPGTTDATFFAHEQGLPVLPALGPGLLRRAHAADEWVSIAAAERSAALYAALAREFCAA